MPPAPLAGNAVTGTPDQAAPGTYAPAPVTRGHGPRKPRALLPRRAARRAQAAALPAAACSTSTASTRAENRGDRQRRLAGLPRPAPRPAAATTTPCSSYLT